ncbi:unnamed protein product [Adineta steineri]|uniref:Uncharacterized protein n=1 Tax=Adineta steineri TaxID=433720 RepID=A0A818W464_9BILA|nr:unnamed protein product [Adineta steineri]CAF3720252.1 unnamed protein product [Adineta steineri]
MPLLKNAQRRLDAQREIINHFSRVLPSFNDLFDEHSWYIFFACLTLFSFLMAFILSRFVTIDDVDYDYKNRNRRSNPFSNIRRTRLF